MCSNKCIPHASISVLLVGIERKKYHHSKNGLKAITVNFYSANDHMI